MKTWMVAVVGLSFSVAAQAQQSNPGSGSYSRSAQHKSKNSAESRVGGSPTNPPERGSSAQGRPRAGYDVGVASGAAGGRTDTGPIGGSAARPRSAGQDQANIEQNAPRRDTPRGARTEDSSLDRAPARQPPTLADPTPQEIAAAQARGRIRDQEKPPEEFSEQDWPNPAQAEQAIANPYQRRQKNPPNQ
jgi:hypothetical protein